MDTRLAHSTLPGRPRAAGPQAAPVTAAAPPRVQAPTRSQAPEGSPPPFTPPGTELLAGTRIGERYIIEGRLGHGGFAAVYRARQESLGRSVAIKVLRPHPRVPLESQRARLWREAEALARLTEPHCVRIYDLGELPDGRPWIAQELVVGTRLDVALRGGPFGEDRAVEVAAQVLEGLAEAHALGVVHRDIKPDNIMLITGVDGRERVKVLDFGIARLQAPHDTESFRTSTHHVFGTPQYMSPEQARQDALSPAADLYAVGILLYRMLTGREPFDGPNGYEILRAQVQDPVPTPVGVSAPLWAVMQCALAKQASERHPSASAMRLALLAARAQPAEAARRRFPLVTCAVAVGLAAGFALGVAAARSDRHAAIEAAPTQPAAWAATDPPGTEGQALCVGWMGRLCGPMP